MKPFSLLRAVLFVSIVKTAAAQDGGAYKAGQKILWHDSSTDKWQEGTFVRGTPGNTQPIIQTRPGDPNSQRAYDWQKIKAWAAPEKPAAPGPAAAGGAGKFRPGQKIWYRVGGTWPPKWEQGTFVAETPGGTQPIIRRKPDQFHPDGAQSAYLWDDVRADAPAATTPGNAPIRLKPQPKPNADPNRQPQPGAPPGRPGPAAGGPPLTEDEILKFLGDGAGNDPFADPPKLQQTKDALAALIKKRGTAFRHESSISPFSNKLTAFGYTSDITGPLGKNFGPPNTQDWLIGTWVTAKTGLPVNYREGADLRRWNEIGALNTGSVTINADGTYVWNTASAQGVIRGKWHAATAAESGDHGGAGVILQNAKNGAHWHAYKNRAGNPQEEWLGLDHLPERSIREGAMRIPAGPQPK